MNINADFFENMYQKDPDPWRFASNTYELNRYQRICDVITPQKPRYVFEAGCSIGILTKQLALLAEFVDAIDISPTAISIAKRQCETLSNTQIHCHSLANYPLNPCTDLIILSEIGYYFETEEWRDVLNKLFEKCPSSFYLLASHWLGSSKDHVIGGDEVHAVIYSLDGLQLLYSERNQNFRLDYWMKK